LTTHLYGLDAGGRLTLLRVYEPETPINELPPDSDERRHGIALLEAEGWPLSLGDCLSLEMLEERKRNRADYERQTRILIDAALTEHDADAELAAADRYREICAHIDAGRIRRHRGESREAFHRRVIRGDFVIIDNLIDFQIERARRANTKGSP